MLKIYQMPNIQSIKIIYSLLFNYEKRQFSIHAIHMFIGMDYFKRRINIIALRSKTFRKCYWKLKFFD